MASGMIQLIRGGITILDFWALLFLLLFNLIFVLKQLEGWGMEGWGTEGWGTEGWGAGGTEYWGLEIETGV